MCKALKELFADEKMKGCTEGGEEGVRDVAIRMIQKDKDDQEIMELTGCGFEGL